MKIKNNFNKNLIFDFFIIVNFMNGEAYLYFWPIKLCKKSVLISKHESIFL